MEIGYSKQELIKLVTKEVVQITMKIDKEIPPRTPDIYAWVENLFGHNSRVYSEAIVAVVDANNQKIAEQLDFVLKSLK